MGGHKGRQEGGTDGGQAKEKRKTEHKGDRLQDTSCCTETDGKAFRVHRGLKARSEFSIKSLRHHPISTVRIAPMKQTARTRR